MLGLPRTGKGPFADGHVMDGMAHNAARAFVRVGVRVAASSCSALASNYGDVPAGQLAWGRRAHVAKLWRGA